MLNAIRVLDNVLLVVNVKHVKIIYVYLEYVIIHVKFVILKLILVLINVKTLKFV